MADNTIAKAYVQIIPTTKGITNNLSKELSGSTDEAGTSAGKSFGKKMLGAVAALGIGAAIGNVIKQSLSEGAALEQSFGGLETIYGEAANAAKAYAAEAAKAGISANSYAEQAVSFGASLKQAFGGDVQKAAEAANTAIMDMTDNAAKMGTPIENIQNAYQGFAKQNYTMLDNLKLGYGGTKTEMERLLADAQKLTGVEYNIDNLGDVYDAIHAVQGSLGLTGVAAEEAKTTLQGSLGAMKAEFQNVLGGLALGEDITPSLNALSSTVTTFITGNLIPMATNVISALPQALSTMLTTLAPALIPAGIDILTSLLDGISATIPQLTEQILLLVPTMVTQLIDGLPQLVDSGFKLLLGLVNGVINAFPKLIEQAPVLIGKFIGTISTLLPQVLEMGITLIVKLAAGLIKAIPQLVKNIPQVISAIVNGLGKGLKSMADVGLNLVKGLWNGINNALGWVLDKIRGFGNAILNGIKSIFGIHSPSTETAWMGDMLMQGLANGIDDNAKKAVNSMRNAADEALGAVDTGAFSFGGGNFSVNGASGNVGTNNITLNVYGAQGQDVRELANIVMAEIQSATERRVAAFA